MALSPKSQHDAMAKKILARRGEGAKAPEVPEVTQFADWTKKRVKALMDEFDVEYAKKNTLPELIALAIEAELTEGDE